MDETKTELKFNEAMDIIGGLSNPSKMPWFGFSLSAFKCKTGSKLREIEGSTCSKCYACRGNYRFRNVQNALEKRLLSLEHPRFVEAFILVLTTLYNRSNKVYKVGRKTVKENRFRWHDSGDLQSVDHLRMVCDIAIATPFLIHWLPTREFGMVSQFLKEGGVIPDNLVVRLSAVMVGEGFENRPMGLPTSTVGVATAGHQCPAYQQDGQCKNCRACWDASNDVNYPLH